MSTKLRRIQVSLPMDLETMIEKEAEFSRRPVSNQIVYILDQWFGERKKELDYFRPTRLHEAKPADGAQFFQTPVSPQEEHLSKIREKLGRDST